MFRAGKDNLSCRSKITFVIGLNSYISVAVCHMEPIISIRLASLKKITFEEFRLISRFKMPGATSSNVLSGFLLCFG
jgi:hypothetical protein